MLGAWCYCCSALFSGNLGIVDVVFVLVVRHVGAARAGTASPQGPENGPVVEEDEKQDDQGDESAHGEENADEDEDAKTIDAS